MIIIEILLFQILRKAMWRLVLGIVALFSGTLIYLGGRGVSHPVSQLFMKAGFERQVVGLSQWGSEIKWSEWVLYSLPDGLWMYSFMVFIMALWGYKWEGYGKYWIVATGVMGIALEVLQSFISSLGTFDLIDLIFISIASYLAIFFNIKTKR